MYIRAANVSRQNVQDDSWAVSIISCSPSRMIDRSRYEDTAFDQRRIHFLSFVQHQLPESSSMQASLRSSLRHVSKLS